MFDTPLGRLRAVGFAEGVSFLVLLGIAMPLKYFADMPEAVKVVGWVHGVLFMAFALTVAQTSQALHWPFSRVVAAMIAAVLPFGPFVFDRKLREEAAAPVPSKSG